MCSHLIFRVISMGFKWKRSKKFPKLPIRPADINRVTLQQDREFNLLCLRFISLYLWFCCCVPTKENAYYLSLFAYRTWSSKRSICQAISRFWRHLGPAWHILPRSHVFSFSHPRAGIYFVTLVRSQMQRWRFSVYYSFVYSFSCSFQFFYIGKFPF